TKFVERYFYGQRPFGRDDKADSEAEDEAELDDEFGDVLNALFSTPSTAEENPGASEDHAEAPVDEEEGPKGFLGWLN
ncbi:hypothetical protein QMO35_28635, partial [Pseudomonas aeruginosa]|nr:hypothetical protein [Pseudomonas aeruginosa]